jgi:hypothetical protein
MLPKAPSSYRPWTVSGGPDPHCDDAVRDMHHRALTGDDLLDRYRLRFPEGDRADYEDVVRRLGHVWDCPLDGAANVTGFLCAICRGTRTEVAEHSRRAPRGASGLLARLRAVATPSSAAVPDAIARRVDYVRHLCEAFADRGVDALEDLAPADVEWSPRMADGRAIRGTRELRAFFAGREAPGAAARPSSVEAIGDHVLVRFDHGGRSLWSLYIFDDGRLTRAISFDREYEALTAAY